MNLEKFNKIKESYGNPFAETSFHKSLNANEIHESFQEDKVVSFAGRLISKREHGKSGFAHLRDHTGKIQMFAQKNTLNEKFDLFKDLDVGDIIGVKGKLFLTRTGEQTILAEELVLLSKIVRVLPEKWHGLKDVEVRYRQRYLDMVANPQVADVFIKRSKIVCAVRKFFEDKAYLEVETPMLHHVAGGAAGRPFKTHHNATDSDVYLRIAPELYLKRLLVGGLERVYEINRSFRNEGVSTKHNPEFTMLEAYCAYQNFEYMMDLCEELVCSLAEELHGTLKINYQDRQIDFTRPWQRISFAGLFKDEFGVVDTDTQDEVFAKVAQKLTLPKGLTRTQIMNIIEELIEKKFPIDKPAFITDFFTWSSPLSKAKKDNPNVVERFELFIAGMELANAYSELNDPVEQESRFTRQLAVEEELPKKIDTDFLVALQYAMPPAAGLGIGIDRLVMILLDQPSIRDVVLFPLLKPLKENDADTQDTHCVE
ncbi:MAG: lysine--tRNA ligase [Candidatus Omnitrophica bacterium]|nr:lysine--tRNA ligase [Candidatus Omnitrophota bacterium]MDD5081112.1 lysine--tRNA ligase [Candidatus Omnitrophota bacterium]